MPVLGVAVVVVVTIWRGCAVLVTTLVGIPATLLLSGGLAVLRRDRRTRRLLGRARAVGMRLSVIGGVVLRSVVLLGRAVTSRAAPAGGVSQWLLHIAQVVVGWVGEMVVSRRTCILRRGRKG